MACRYKIELLCDYAEWWRFNVYIIAVGYDAEGNRVSFNDFTDRVYELDYGGDSRNAPAGFDKSRPLSLLTDPCDHADIYLYAVTNTFPDSPDIKDSPPFEVVMRVTVDGREVERESYEVNQWGGLTVVARRVSAAG